MKVLHVEAGRRVYGGGRQVLYLMEGLRQRGVEGMLACPRHSPLAQAAAAKGLDTRPLAMGGDLDAAVTLRLWRLIRSEGPDLVHVHSRRGADLWGALAARLVRPRPRLVVSRRVDNPEPAPWARRKYGLYDRVVTISERIREVLLAEGVAEAKVVCVPSAVDPDAFRQPCDRAWLERELGIPREARLLAVVAQLIPRKGHRHLLDALPAVLASRPDVRVLFFGQGELEAELRGRIAGMGLAGQVLLMGYSPRLPRVLPCLEALVHPALMEGLGVAVLEAAAAGVPAVAFRRGGVPEIVVDGVTGRLLEPGDTAGLQEALGALLDDPARGRALGDNARARVAARFSVPAMVAGNLAVYAALLAGD